MKNREYGILLRLGLPILVGQLGIIATGFADNIMVGHYSTEALASASFCNNVFNVALLTCMGFTFGVTPIVGALYARQSSAETGAVVRAALKLNTAFGLLVTLIMTIVYLNLHRLGQPAELLPLIRPYYLTCLAGIVPMTLFNVMAQWSYGINNTGMPTVVILGANGLNILGNYMLIYGNWGMPEMGLTGAGISTLVSRVVCCAVIVGIFALRGVNAPYRHGFVHTRVPGIMRKLWNTSLPVSLQMACETSAFSLSAVLCGWLGKIELASFQIIVTIGTLGFCVYYAIAAAVAVRVANGVGTGDKAAMRRAASCGYHILLCIMGCTSLLFVIGGRTMMGFFTNDPAVTACAASLIVPLVLYQAADATQMNYANALRGTGAVQPMMWIAMVSYLLLGLPVSYALGFTLGLGIYGIVLSFSLSLGSAALLYLYFFRRAVR